MIFHCLHVLDFPLPLGHHFPMEKVFTPCTTAVALHKPIWWFAFNAKGMLVIAGDNNSVVPCSADFIPDGILKGAQRCIGTIDGVQCLAISLPEEVEPQPDMKFQGLRKLFHVLDDAFFRAAMRALSIVNWEKSHKFCGHCGAPTRQCIDMLAQQCTRCESMIFPRLSPAVIVLVEKDDKILLAHAGRFQDGKLYSVLAGFVEPGETLEETVKREIREETGIDVKDIRYFGSQPWPFPDSLMIAFTAQYAGGEICVDNEEILHAAWFGADELPAIPDRVSISRALIDWFVAKRGQKRQITEENGK